MTSLSRGEVLDNLLGAGIVVYSVGASNYVTDWYGPFVDATGGLFFDINGNFRDILLSISRFGRPARYLAWYDSRQQELSQVTIDVEVHYAGLGGIDTVGGLAGKVDSHGLAPPEDSSSLQGWPNPFSSSVTLRFPADASGSLEVFDLLGRRVHRSRITGGTLTWDGRSDDGRPLPNGQYIARARIGTATSHLVLTRVR
ncbi:MAG: hypothetical protein HKN29_02650 [Rhodothermales bacterium]|nr:hypothetical protein [Rhodothermales bacterium]